MTRLDARAALLRVAELDDAILERQVWVRAARDHLTRYTAELEQARRLLEAQRRSLARLEKTPCVASGRLEAARAAVAFQELFEAAFARLLVEDGQRADEYAGLVAREIERMLGERAQVRTAVPSAILGRYDALLATGRRPIAWLVRGACSACAARVADGSLAAGLALCPGCELLVSVR